MVLQLYIIYLVILHEMTTSAVCFFFNIRQSSNIDIFCNLHFIVTYYVLVSRKIV